jgi:hypothetical protein
MKKVGYDIIKYRLSTFPGKKKKKKKLKIFKLGKTA